MIVLTPIDVVALMMLKEEDTIFLDKGSNLTEVAKQPVNDDRVRAEAKEEAGVLPEARQERQEEVQEKTIPTKPPEMDPAGAKLSKIAEMARRRVEPDVATRTAPTQDQALEVLMYLNLKADRRYRLTVPTAKFILDRLKSGISVETLKRVVDAKVAEWTGTDMAKYLRPETLFNATKCESYVGALDAKNTRVLPKRTMANLRAAKEFIDREPS